ncbi:type 11 methyltransferase [Geoanaerobacter pelophilus]|uniref:Type 11 methyltransferase n=1 Tax=Geoanaerobacter pelophilus TaxID=60036 RepID=A0ABQ0MN61_9BACT|nr:class I SAM-dependent methyltransferase [Geoanaerobacter pelophilus]GAW68522.1 type 11 methyltransferase [Geoanaerobacter pelophilus]
MDLKEMRDEQLGRHPWETARAAAVAGLLESCLHQGMSVLDLGCGDGYLSRTLFRHLSGSRVTSVDPNLTPGQLALLRERGEWIAYQTELPPEVSRFDLTLLLDVLEHVPEDRDFLTQVVAWHTEKGGHVLVTVPAFPALYSGHDFSLGHYRRYRLQELEGHLASAGLAVVVSGHLFASLLFPKYFLFKLLDRSIGPAGVGCWRGGRILTALLEAWLKLENSAMILLARRGVRLPGLTAWALCVKKAAEP